MEFTLEQVDRIRELRLRYIQSNMTAEGTQTIRFFAERRDGATKSFLYGMLYFLNAICNVRAIWHLDHVEFEVAENSEFHVKCTNSWVMKLCNDIQKTLNDRERNAMTIDFS